MLIYALSLLGVVALLVAIGMHLGPHSAVIGGALGFVASCIFFIMVVTSSSSNFGIAVLSATIVALALGAGTLVFGARSVQQTRRTVRESTSLSLWNETGLALSDLSPMGTVQIGGETWSAEAVGAPISRGAAIYVVEIDKLHIRVAENPLHENP